MSDKIKQALCCVCGSLRTCRRPRNYRRENYWLHEPVDRDWHRETGELKCAECNRITVHAIVLPDSDGWRNHAEKVHKVATGWVNESLTEKDHDRIRAGWREGLPRNPYMKHYWWISDENEAREEGRSHLQAICKETIAVPTRTPEERDNSTRMDELVAPSDFHDVDREDPATGLWWFDLECPDCLRRSNSIALNAQRRALKEKLQEIVGRVDKLDAPTVAELLANFHDAESCES